MRQSSDTRSHVENAPAIVRAKKRQADAWIEDDVDFAVQRRGAAGSRTIELEASPPPPPPEPIPNPRKEAWLRRGEAAGGLLLGTAALLGRTVKRGGHGLLVAVRIASNDPKELAQVTATELDRAGHAVGGKAKEVGGRAGHAVESKAREVGDRAKEVGGRAKDVGDEVAAVAQAGAQAGADRVNHVRRAGLPPVRERHVEKPRITASVNERRPRRRLAERIGSHPDRIVLWAVALGVFLIIIAATSSSKAATPKPRLGDRVLSVGATGYDVRLLHRKLKAGGFYAYKISSKYTKRTKTGVKAYQSSRCLTPADGVAGKATIAALRARKASCVATPAVVTAAAPVVPELGSRMLRPGMNGNDVRVLQKLLAITQSSIYDAATAGAVKSFQQTSNISADGVAGPQTFNALGNRMPTYAATWYGPGLFGNTTACGQTLATTTQGVANRTLPCGTEVVFFLNGRFKTTTVIDRGPYANNTAWDLTQATATDLGLLATANVHAAY